MSDDMCSGGPIGAPQMVPLGSNDSIQINSSSILEPVALADITEEISEVKLVSEDVLNPLLSDGRQTTAPVDDLEEMTNVSSADTICLEESSPILKSLGVKIEDAAPLCASPQKVQMETEVITQLQVKPCLRNGTATTGGQENTIDSYFRVKKAVRFSSVTKAKLASNGTVYAKTPIKRSTSIPLNPEASADPSAVISATIATNSEMDFMSPTTEMFHGLLKRSRQVFLNVSSSSDDNDRHIGHSPCAIFKANSKNRKKLRRTRSEPYAARASSPTASLLKRTEVSSTSKTSVSLDFVGAMAIRSPLCLTEDSYSLPCIKSKCDAIMRVTPGTVADIVEGHIGSSLDKVYILDCRFPFEYEAGHIRGALNINSPTDMENLLLKSPASADQKVAIIFHCEFSSHRAPGMALRLRKQDRASNAARYPDLFFPELYIMEGGYKSFFTHFQRLCVPETYMEMHDDRFSDQLKVEMANRRVAMNATIQPFLVE